MAWNIGPLIVYHGTDSGSAFQIRNHGGIKAAFFNPQCDFGEGFYVTTSLHQAKSWANERIRLLSGSPYNAEVLEYQIDRTSLQCLEYLAFVMDTQDYHELVDYCWTGGKNHGWSRSQPYDAIYGPVSLWPQRLVIANCDQICFGDPGKIREFQSPLPAISAAPSKFF